MNAICNQLDLFKATGTPSYGDQFDHRKTRTRRGERIERAPDEQVPEAAPRHSDPTAQRLEELGLWSRYALLSGYSTSAPAETLTGQWALPSRLFQFPCGISGRDGDTEREIHLKHNALRDHPFVQLLESHGFTVRDLEPTDHGFGNGSNGEWHHAVDLVAKGHVDQLLETRHFTTTDAICGALVYGMHYGKDGQRKPHIDPPTARRVLGQLGLPRTDEADTALERLSFDEFKGEGGKLQRAINGPNGVSRAAAAWAWIEAIEMGWIKQGRFATFTDAAKDRRRATLL